MHPSEHAHLVEVAGLMKGGVENLPKLPALGVSANTDTGLAGMSERTGNRTASENSQSSQSFL